MKNLILAFALLFTAQFANAQFFAMGLKGGLHTQTSTPKDIIIGGDDANFDLGVDQFRFGGQFGGYLRFGKRFFVQPEVVFNSNKTDYSVKQSNLPNAIYTEKFNTLDIPVLAGIKLGPVRLVAGPVGHYFLSSKSELTELDGYKEKFKQMTWGYQTGLNIAFGRVSADLRYEGNFNNTGDHITFFGDKYSFSNNPSRFIFGLNFAIVK
jgi:Outer membrane protein beta-barrel domain